MTYMLRSLIDTMFAEFEKLKMQKFIHIFFFIFIGAGLATASSLLFFDANYVKISQPAETLEWWHSVLFQSVFTLCLAFVGSSQICREYEKGMIKNIILTGIPLPFYLFSRLAVFFGVFSVILLLTYTIDSAVMFAYFGRHFDLWIVGKSLFLTLLHLLQTLFLIVMFSSLFKNTTHAIAALLLYYILLEKILVKILISMSSYLNFSSLPDFLVQHSPLQVLDNLHVAFKWNDYAVNFSVFILYLCIYAVVIWLSSRDTELGLINKK